MPFYQFLCLQKKRVFLGFGINILLIASRPKV
jgi:hypothetical protein